jgi:hypothetical protein
MHQLMKAFLPRVQAGIKQVRGWSVNRIEYNVTQGLALY